MSGNRWEMRELLPRPLEKAHLSVGGRFPLQSFRWELMGTGWDRDHVAQLGRFPVSARLDRARVWLPPPSPPGARRRQPLPARAAPLPQCYPSSFPDGRPRLSL
jgi:hypothetical protein